MQPITRFAVDFEAAGPDIHRHAPLSIGVCLVPRTPLSLQTLIKRGYLFYAELPPGSKLSFDLEAARVGMSHLECLTPMRASGLGEYDHTSAQFRPEAVLAHMNSILPPVQETVQDLKAFVRKYTEDETVEAVFDTALFDSVLLKNLVPDLFGHRGLELASCYRGMRRDYSAQLKDVVRDQRERPHHSGEDACWLAQIAQRLVHEELRWP